jgi:AcrR family transcriptional regulator
MDAAEAGAPAAQSPPVRAGYRRSAGSQRGEARRQELLGRVGDDLAANGLVDFSLRRAARAAGTTHKVLLYYFDGPDDLLRQAMILLRERRIGNVLAAATRGPADRPLSARVRAAGAVLMGEDPGLRVLEQAVGLAMYDPGRFAGLGQEAWQQYLPPLLSVCPEGWSDRRKLEVAEMILAVLQGFRVDWLASGDTARVAAGFDALTRALEREEAASG